MTRTIRTRRSHAPPRQKAVRTLYDMLARLAYVCDAVRQAWRHVAARADAVSGEAELAADLRARPAICRRCRCA